MLYKTFEDKWKRPCGNIWIYSDPHFGDVEMQQLRHNCVNDDEQVNQINAKVSKNDTLIILGDIGDTNYVSKLKAGYKVLIVGNHDKGVSNYKREIKETEHTDNHLFDEIYEGPLMVNKKLLLSHEPIPVPEYIFNIHGHDHNNREGLNDTQHLNVCAEHINYEPISLLKLIKDGLLANIPDIHQTVVKKATEHKK